MLTIPEERRAASHPYVAQFKRWWHEHLLQLCRLMLTFHEPETLLSWQIDSSWWYFAIANASEESRTRLVDIQTDPRICPYRIQLLWDSRWRSAKMFVGITRASGRRSKLHYKLPDDSGTSRICMPLWWQCNRLPERQRGFYFQYWPIRLINIGTNQYWRVLAIFIIFTDPLGAP